MILSGDTLSFETYWWCCIWFWSNGCDSTSGFAFNEHINHGSVSIMAGTGLNGGGTILYLQEL